MSVRRVLRSAALLSLVVLSACSSTRLTGGQPGATRSVGGGSAVVASGATFFARSERSDGDLVEASASTGAVERTVAPGRRDGLGVRGVSGAGAHQLLVTYSKDPDCTSGVPGCGPRPHTCGGEVVRVDPSSGATEVVWRVGVDELLTDAVASPDGTEIAAVAAPCVPSYFNAHIAVHRLSDGATWTLGAGLPRCHALQQPHWLADGTHLVVSYAPAPRGPAYDGPDGTCSSVRLARLVVVDASGAQPGISGRVLPAPKRCSWESTAVDRGSIYAIEACGSANAPIDGPVTLHRLTSSLTDEQRWRIGTCTDGNSLAAAGGRVLVSAYLYCGGSSKGGPATILARVDGTRLAALAEQHLGYLFWDDLTW